MRKFLPYVILLAAFSVSASAAYYSIYGLSKLFAGASVAVIIMASCLEFSKLVIATLLKQYWNNITTILRVYLTFALVVLVFITSIGIYGFLSSAYQSTSMGDKIALRQIELIDAKINQYTEVKNDLLKEKNIVETSISELRTSLGSSHTQHVDRKTGQLVSNSSSSVRKSLELQLKDAVKNRDDVSLRYQSTIDSIGKFDLQKIEITNSSEMSSELGPLRYINALTGISMDRVVNYFLLLIIFVFDPLAIALILAANYIFSMNKTSLTTKISTLTSKQSTDELITKTLNEPTLPANQPTDIDELINELDSEEKKS